jgi:hypothetical protein
LRRLFIIGSSAVVLQASKRGVPAGSWLEGMLARKPGMLITFALANMPCPDQRERSGYSPKQTVAGPLLETRQSCSPRCPVTINAFSIHSNIGRSVGKPTAPAAFLIRSHATL